MDLPDQIWLTQSWFVCDGGKQEVQYRIGPVVSQIENDFCCQ